MCRSTNSAPYLKRGEYDFDDEYAEIEPWIAVERSGCVEVRSDRRGSGCDWLSFSAHSELGWSDFVGGLESCGGGDATKSKRCSALGPIVKVQGGRER
jgi:hypothetical protein